MLPTLVDDPFINGPDYSLNEITHDITGNPFVPSTLFDN